MLSRGHARAHLFQGQCLRQGRLELRLRWRSSTRLGAWSSWSVRQCAILEAVPEPQGAVKQQEHLRWSQELVQRGARRRVSWR